MTIEKSQPEYSIGTFIPNPNLDSNPEIRYKTAIREDIVIPRFTLDANLLFTKGGAGLRAEAKQSMQGIVEFIGMFTPSKVVIEGHTDSDGNDKDNLTLSEERANSMRSFLVDTYEFISPGMVEAIGYGEERPIAPNDSEQNKGINRRVEIVIWE
jgi:outer membrane protein OmpA-like peptidoglycan-associated protein